MGHVLPRWRRRGLGAVMLAHSEGRVRQIATATPPDGQRFSGRIVRIRQPTRSQSAAGVEEDTPVRWRWSRSTWSAQRLAAHRARRCRRGWRFDRSAQNTGVSCGISSRSAGWTMWSSRLPPRTVTSSGPAGRSGTRASGWSLGTAVSRSGWCSTSSSRTRMRGTGGGAGTPSTSTSPGRGAQSFDVLERRGMTEAALGMYANSPTRSRQLYEGLGYRVVRSSFVYRNPLNVPPT